MSYEYAYASLIFSLGILWLMLFAVRADTRHHQFSMSILTAPLGLIQYWFSQDYWQPSYLLPSFRINSSVIGIEEIIFAFFIGGIVAVIYEIVFRKKYRNGHKRTREAFVVVIGGLLLFLLLKYVGLNTIWASSTGAILVSLVLIYIDRDLCWDCILSAVVMFVVILFLYTLWFLLFPDAVAQLWLPQGLSGINLSGIPIEEFAWYTSWAMFGGIFYEFWVNAGRYSNFCKRKIKRA